MELIKFDKTKIQGNKQLLFSKDKLEVNMELLDGPKLMLNNIIRTVVSLGAMQSLERMNE